MHVQATLRLLVSLLLLLSAGRVLADAAGDIRKLEQERFAAYILHSGKTRAGKIRDLAFPAFSGVHRAMTLSWETCPSVTANRTLPPWLG